MHKKLSNEQTYLLPERHECVDFQEVKRGYLPGMVVLSKIHPDRWTFGYMKADDPCTMLRAENLTGTTYPTAPAAKWAMRKFCNISHP